MRGNSKREGEAAYKPADLGRLHPDQDAYDRALDSKQRGLESCLEWVARSASWWAAERERTDGLAKARLSKAETQLWHAIDQAYLSCRGGPITCGYIDEMLEHERRLADPDEMAESRRQFQALAAAAHKGRSR